MNVTASFIDVSRIASSSAERFAHGGHQAPAHSECKTARRAAIAESGPPCFGLARNVLRGLYSLLAGLVPTRTVKDNTSSFSLRAPPEAAGPT